MLFKVFLLRVDLAELEIEYIVIRFFNLCLFELHLLDDFFEYLVNEVHVLNFLDSHVLYELVALTEQQLRPLTLVVQRVHNVVCILLQYKSYSTLDWNI